MGATVQSVERAFSILETFDEQHPTRTAADIAAASGLARPTTYRMLQTLRRLGYVRNVNGQFEVTPRVLRLGAGYLGRASLAARAGIDGEAGGYSILYRKLSHAETLITTDLFGSLR